MYMLGLVVAVASVVTLYLLYRRKKEKEKSTKYVKSFLFLFEGAKPKLEKLSGGEYLNNAKVKRWLNSDEGIYIKTFDHSLIKPDLLDESLRLLYMKARQRDALSYKINDKFVKRRLLESKEMFDNLGLTKSQRLAVVRDEDANLINAGAGSGKTRTILAKVKYIVERNLASSAEILIVVYNKKIKQEVEEKVKRADPNIKVTTFHSLGLSIIKESENGLFNISGFADDERKLADFLIEKMKDLFNFGSTLNLLSTFFTTSRFEGNPENEVETQDEYFSQVGLAGLRSLNGVKLKSQQEVMIANWLTLNGIDWKYEQNYPHVENGKRYKPDFYLPDYRLWIEHFGIDEKGNTAPWVNRKEYNSGIEWKRETHQKNQTNLVETYSYEAKKDGGLTRALEEKLSEYGVKKKPVSKEVVDDLVQGAFRPIPNFIKLIMQFLSLSKENELDKQNLEKNAVSLRDQIFLRIFNLFREFYEIKLQADSEIDFADMIVRGIEHVKNGKYQSCYKYILVDEYQDITKVRLEFLLSLQSQVEDARLFCVGDDWQSIYQFQGANVSLIKDFEKYVDSIQRTDLDQTFRYPQKVSDFSSIFITQNPAQLKKEIISSIASEDEDRPIKIIHYESTEYEKAFNEIVDDIVRQSECRRQTCFVLGRYNHSKPASWNEITKYSKSNGIDMEFSTIHKSKGRESDWVVVLENKSDLYGSGFPSEIQGDPVLKMVMPDEDVYLNAEERRLFYVAVTRTRKGVFLLVPAGKASQFIREISPKDEMMDTANENIYEPFVEVKGNSESKMFFCPRCNGKTIQRQFREDGSFFYVCSHYPSCLGTLPACKNRSCNTVISLKVVDCEDFYRCVCGHEYKICPRCKNGILEKRTGVNGKFLGCSQYGTANCSYTENMPR